MPHRGYRERSKADWGNSEEKLTIEQINCGALLRVADATEAMAQNFLDLQREAKWLKEERDRLRIQQERLLHSNAALRGHLKRIKRSR